MSQTTEQMHEGDGPEHVDAVQALNAGEVPKATEVDDLVNVTHGFYDRLGAGKVNRYERGKEYVLKCRRMEEKISDFMTQYQDELETMSFPELQTALSEISKLLSKLHDLSSVHYNDLIQDKSMLTHQDFLLDETLIERAEDLVARLKDLVDEKSEVQGVDQMMSN